MSLLNWPAGAALQALREIFEMLVPASELEQRIQVPVPAEYPDWLSPYLRWGHVEPQWDRLPPITRVLYGKLSVIEHDRRRQLERNEDRERINRRSATRLWEHAEESG